MAYAVLAVAAPLPAAIRPTTCSPHTVTGPRARHHSGGPGDSAQAVCTVLALCTSNPRDYRLHPVQGPRSVASLYALPPTAVTRNCGYLSHDLIAHRSASIRVKSPTTLIPAFRSRWPLKYRTRSRSITTPPFDDPAPTAVPSRSNFPPRDYEHGYPHRRFSRQSLFLPLHPAIRGPVPGR